MTEKELQLREKDQLDVERTEAGPTYVPMVDIYETDQALTLLADMPGVDAKGVSVDLKDNVLTISGRLTAQAGKEHLLYQEYATGSYMRSFTVSEKLDQTKIEASMKDGVLTLVLPKQEKLQPRAIEVKAG